MATRTSPELTVDEKRRLIRRLLDQQGRGFAEACGFRVTNSPSNLFGLLYLSMLAAACRDYRRAVALASALRAQGWDSAVRMAEAPPGQRVRVLREAGADRGAGRLAGVLGDLAAAVRDRYRGDLRRLRTEAGRDPDRERRLLLALPGVEHRTVELFFREVQVVWPEIAPFADGPALAAARRLGLGRRVEELRALTGDESEKLAWLLGALARVDQDGAYERAGALARA